jgi:hypothetical protein
VGERIEETGVAEQGAESVCFERGLSMENMPASESIQDGGRTVAFAGTHELHRSSTL